MKTRLVFSKSLFGGGTPRVAKHTIERKPPSELSRLEYLAVCG
ncbi:MAG: hypothetical protein A4E49_02117 [Methanosaeta sp. PtaU1.Bin112]|nr:MAG: hypothetical protein A4E49_02117 [Methanosaeta sp. PtaU1.Bin112]